MLYNVYGVGTTVTIGSNGFFMEGFIGMVGKITKVIKVSYPCLYEVTFPNGTTKGCQERDFSCIVE